MEFSYHNHFFPSRQRFLKIWHDNSNSHIIVICIVSGLKYDKRLPDMDVLGD